ncbi:MAG: transposase, partial [Lachnospiraceae bacterium]|nr:transposase [Lachnospiraceae bacterium]
MLNISRQMKKFVNDYKMRLVEARQSNLVLHNMNNQDMFNLLEILLDKNSPLNETKNKAIEYAREHDVDKHVIMAVAGATRCKVDYNDLSREGDMDMCTVFEETWSQGKIEGKAEGIIEIGLDCGFTEDEIIAKLQTKLGISQ